MLLRPEEKQKIRRLNVFEFSSFDAIFGIYILQARSRKRTQNICIANTDDNVVYFIIFMLDIKRIANARLFHIWISNIPFHLILSIFLFVSITLLLSGFVHSTNTLILLYLCFSYVFAHFFYCYMRITFAYQTQLQCKFHSFRIYLSLALKKPSADVSTWY